MNCSQIIFSAHSLKSMIRRSISVDEAKEVISDGEVIANYETDKPCPSTLLLKFINDRPVHVFVAQNLETFDCILITCYLPDPNLWDADFKRKIK